MAKITSLRSFTLSDISLSDISDVSMSVDYCVRCIDTTNSCTSCKEDITRLRRINNNNAEIRRDNNRLSYKLIRHQKDISLLKKGVQSYDELLRNEQVTSMELRNKLRSVQELCQLELQKADEQKISTRIKLLRTQADLAIGQAKNELRRATEYITLTKLITGTKNLTDAVSETTRASLWKNSFAYGEYQNDLKKFIHECEKLHDSMLSNLRNYTETQDFKSGPLPKSPELEMDFTYKNAGFWISLVQQIFVQNRNCPPNKLVSARGDNIPTELKTEEIYIGDYPMRVATAVKLMDSPEVKGRRPMARPSQGEEKRDLDGSLLYVQCSNTPKSMIISSKGENLSNKPKIKEVYIQRPQLSQPHLKDGTAVKKTELTGIPVPSCSTTCSRGISYSNATKTCCQTQYTEIEPIHKAIVNEENKSEILNQMEVKKLPAAEKLVGYILKTYPLLSRDEAYNYIIKVRNQNGGKLSNLGKSTIIRRIGELIPRKDGINSSPLRAASKHQVLSVHKSSSSGNLPDECSICFEDMKNNLHGSVTMLEPCGHTFHTVCIKQWFIEKRDCPFCRNFTLLKDDYPKLR